MEEGRRGRRPRPAQRPVMVMEEEKGVGRREEEEERLYLRSFFFCYHKHTRRLPTNEEGHGSSNSRLYEGCPARAADDGAQFGQRC